MIKRRQLRLCIASCLFVGTAIGFIVGCGGGGGGSSSGPSSSGRPPFAAQPVCNNISPKLSSQGTSRTAQNSPGVIIPTSSVERSSDIGNRAHTNHLISLKAYQPDASGGAYTPLQITTAYGVPVNAGAGAIALVDAYNYPTALNDFNVFSTQFGLPTESSSSVTANNPVFQVVYASGTAPVNDGSWSQEMSLDIEWAHAMAPRAKIYLVEAASSNFADLITAVNVAKTLPGVREVSMSFGGSEAACLFVQYDSVFVQSGVTFFGAAGDSAGERDFPALSSNVISVGGTTLNMTLGGIYSSESVWSDTGCGPSAFEPRPVYQDGFYKTIGLYRGACDIAAVGDPNTGVAVYDSTAYQGSSGWMVVGGTSLSTPVIAGIANSSGQSFSSSASLLKTLYSLAGSSYFHAVKSGSAAGFKAGTPWCFPAGLGTPNGLGAGL